MQKERFFSPLQIAVELQLWDTLNIQIHWYTEFTDILKGPVVQTLMLQMRETEAFLLVGTWSQNSWFPTNLETKICGSVKKLYVLCLVTQLCFSLSMRILQARILEWVAMPSFRGSSLPRDWTQVSCIAGGFFTIWTTREAQEYSWVAYPFSRGSSWPSSRTRISLTGGDSLAAELLGKPQTVQFQKDWCLSIFQMGLLRISYFTCCIFIEFRIVVKCN